VARLEAIRDLQAHGLTLTAIRRLLDQAPGHAASTALAFVKAAVAQTADEGTETISAEEGAARLGMAVDEVDPELVERMGMARVLEDGRRQVLVPSAFEAAAELARAGVPADKRVEVGQALHEHAQAMARAVVDLFVEHLWRPSDHHADDPEAWTALTEAVERLRPLATATVASFFGVAPGPEAEAGAERARASPSSGARRARGGGAAGAQVPAPRVSGAVSAAARMRALHPAIAAGGTASSAMRAAVARKASAAGPSPSTTGLPSSPPA